jgi:hypothetical protein
MKMKDLLFKNIYTFTDMNPIIILSKNTRHRNLDRLELYLKCIGSTIPAERYYLFRTSIEPIKDLMGYVEPGTRVFI